jgi:hypothetical protein
MIAPEYICHTARSARLARFRRYYDGTQYDGRPDFWTGGPQRVPLRERAPCVVYPLPKNAVLEATRFTFGEGRFPALTVKPVEADSAAGLALSTDDAKRIERVLDTVARQAKLRTVMRGMLRAGLTTGSACAILALRQGRFCVEVANAEHCAPTFVDDDPNREVIALTWCYEFEREVEGHDGKPTKKRFAFRRDITASEFVDYEHAPIETGKRIEWRESRRVPHGFTFCPVVWVRNLPDPASGDIDGQSIFDTLLDEFDALNFALSQRHRGITFFGTPQPYETGVDEDDGPEADGRQSGPQGFSRGDSTAPFGKAAVPARRIAPDSIWSYRGQAVNVGLIETTGKAFEVATAHVNDIAARLKESMGVVLASASETLGKGDMSAKFLALVYAPLLALVDDLRECWWADALEPLLVMVLRAIVDTGGRGLLVPGAQEVARIMASRVVQTEAGPVWLAPELSPLWGHYFSPSNEDIKVGVETAAKAKESGVATTRSAARFVGEYFGSSDESDRVLHEPSVEQALQVAALSIGSPTFDRLYRARVASSLLGAVDESDANAIASEIEGSTPTADAMRSIDQAETEAPDEQDVDDSANDTPIETATAVVKIDLTSTDIASIVSVNEARRSQGLSDLLTPDGRPDPDGRLTVSEYKAKHVAVTAIAAAAATGDTSAVEDAQTLT